MALMNEGNARRWIERCRRLLDVIRRRSTASTDDIQQSITSPLTDMLGHGLGRLIVLTECIRQTGVGIADGVGRRAIRDFLQESSHFRRTQRAVQTETRHDDELRCRTAFARYQTGSACDMLITNASTV